MLILKHDKKITPKLPANAFNFQIKLLFPWNCFHSTFPFFLISMKTAPLIMISVSGNYVRFAVVAWLLYWIFPTIDYVAELFYTFHFVHAHWLKFYISMIYSGVNVATRPKTRLVICLNINIISVACGDLSTFMWQPWAFMNWIEWSCMGKLMKKTENLWRWLWRVDSFCSFYTNILNNIPVEELD